VSSAGDLTRESECQDLSGMRLGVLVHTHVVDWRYLAIVDGGGGSRGHEEHDVVELW
jgi:hypothetical protein